MSVVAHRANLGKYRLIAELGQGGMADVYLAVSTGLAGSQKLVVIKQLRQRMIQDDESVGMFLDEGRLAVRLNHPNVVQTFEVGVSEGRHFIVMEYLEGLALNSILRAMRASGAEGLGAAMHLRVLSDMLSGLHYAHESEDYDGTPLKIVHRDITPHNTFVTYDGQTKVVDFGIAKAIRSSTTTTTGVIKGKISYMSPEQSRSEPIDRRSDLYAVGIMLWEAVTGTRFWKGLADMTILQRLMTNQPAPSPREIKPELSDLVVSVCARALAARAEDRYSTAAELQAGVESILEEMGQRHITSRDVGRHVSEFFAETRVKTKALIEAQMRLPPEDVAVLPEIRTQPFGQTTLTPSGDSGRTPSGSAGMRSEYGGGVSARGGRLRVVGLLFGASLLAGAGGAVVFMREPRGPAAAAPKAEPVAAGAEGASKAAAEQVSVRFSAQPAEAKLYLDDQPLRGNPFEGKVPRDGGAHTLRAEAPGYQAKAQPVSLSGDAALEVELGRAPKATEAREVRREVRAGSGRPSGRAAKGAAGGAAAVGAAPTAEAAQGGSIVLPKQPPGGRSIVIDTSDPWKQTEGKETKEKAP